MKNNSWDGETTAKQRPARQGSLSLLFAKTEGQRAGSAPTSTTTTAAYFVLIGTACMEGFVTGVIRENAGQSSEQLKPVRRRSRLLRRLTSNSAGSIPAEPTACFPSDSQVRYRQTVFIPEAHRDRLRATNRAADASCLNCRWNDFDCYVV